MPVTLRGSKWQYDITHKGKRYRQGGFETKAEAERAEAVHKASLMVGRTTEAPTTATPAAQARLQTLEGLYEHVMERYWEGKPSEETNRINATDVVNILGRDTHPNEVDTNALDRLIHKLKNRKDRPLSNATINRKLAALKKMLRCAFERGVIPLMPKFEMLEETEHRIRFWSPEEEAAILEYFNWIGDTDMADLFALLCDTGVRLGTALKLRWQDNFDTGTWEQMVVHGDQDKTKHARAIPLTDRLKNVLTVRFSKAASAGDRLFQLSKDQCEHRWTRCKVSLGRKQEFTYFGEDAQAVLHTCRHTFISRLVQAGVTLPVVQKLAGHKNIQTTMRYAHLRATDFANAIKRMEGVA